MAPDGAPSIGSTLPNVNADLGRRVDLLATMITAAREADTATAAVLRHTPLKGETYAQGVHRLMSGIAAGLGDEYVDTSAVTGLLSRNKKGDGLLAVEGGPVRVVLEMSDSNRGEGWGGYLEEAARNRGASAALGLVRYAEQLKGAGMVSLGARRVVMAFDPGVDNPELLRTVVQLLRLAALAAAARDDSAEVRTAEEKIVEAIRVVGRIDGISRTAGLIKQNASKIDEQTGALRTELSRLLTQARVALSGASGVADEAA